MKKINQLLKLKNILTASLPLLTMLTMLTLLTLLPACDTADIRVEEQTVIRLGHLHNDLHQLAFYVAREKGFYRDAGIAVEITGIYKSGVELMAAFQAGALDAGYVGLAPATVAVANGKADVTVVAQANRVGSAIVIREDLNITSPGELAGLKIAVPNVGNVQDFLLNRALDNAGLKVADIEKTIMPPPEMIAAMIAGGIDGCVVWEPYVSELHEQGHGTILMHSGNIWRDHPCCVLAVDRTFLREHHRETLALVEAHRRATGYILENKEEALKMAVDFTGLSRDIVKAAMKNIGFDYALNVESAALYARYLDEQGLTDIGDYSGFTDSFIDMSFLSKEGDN